MLTIVSDLRIWFESVVPLDVREIRLPETRVPNASHAGEYSQTPAILRHAHYYVLQSGMLIVPAGLLIYGWTAEAQLHFFFPLFGAAVFAFGMLMTYVRIPCPCLLWSYLTQTAAEPDMHPNVPRRLVSPIRRFRARRHGGTAQRVRRGVHHSGNKPVQDPWIRMVSTACRSDSELELELMCAASCRGTTVLALISTVALPIPYLFWRYGQQLRERPFVP